MPTGSTAAATTLPSKNCTKRWRANIPAAKWKSLTTSSVSTRPSRGLPNLTNLPTAASLTPSRRAFRLGGVGSFSRGYGYRFDLSGYFPRAIKTLCIACVSVFLLQEISQFIWGAEGVRFWGDWFGLVPYAVVHGFRLWQPFTYLFLHAGILHILFNLLYLAMFGADLEHTWGSRKFYTYF